MSRGLGKVQRDILEVLDINCRRRRFLFASEVATALAGTDNPSESQYRSALRALRRLEAGGEIQSGYTPTAVNLGDGYRPVCWPVGQPSPWEEVTFPHKGDPREQINLCVPSRHARVSGTHNRGIVLPRIDGMYDLITVGGNTLEAVCHSLRETAAEYRETLAERLGTAPFRAFTATMGESTHSRCRQWFIPVANPVALAEYSPPLDDELAYFLRGEDGQWTHAGSFPLWINKADTPLICGRHPGHPDYDAYL